MKVCRSTNSRSGRKQPHNPHSHPREEQSQQEALQAHNEMSQEYPTLSASDTFPTFTSLFFGFLVHVFFSSFSPSTSFLSAWLGFHSVSPHTFSLGTAPLSSSILFLVMLHKPFCAIKPPTSHSPRSLLHSFLVPLLFCPSIFHPLAFLARALPSSSRRIQFLIFPHSFVSIFCRVCIGSSILLPAGAAHNPNTFCTRLTPLHVGPLFSPYRALPSAFYSIFSACVWSPLAATLDPHMFLACSCFCCFFRILYTDVGLLQHTTSCDSFFASTF